jgi:predicted ester cyclase
VVARPNTIQGQVAEGDQVITHITLEAVHTGPLLGIPPSDRSFTIDAIVVHRFANGKIVAERQFTDSLSLLMQIGALPSWDELVDQAKHTQA